jgi:hypothetical protein
MDNLRPHHDTPPAGMGGTYEQWLRYQEKEERRRRREEKEVQALRTAWHHERDARRIPTCRSGPIAGPPLLFLSVTIVMRLGRAMTAGWRHP